jgi:rod shape-determining protein MreC
VAVSRRSTRSRSTLLLLVLTSVTLLTLDYRGPGSGAIDAVKGGARDLFAPVQDASDRVTAPVRNLVDGIVHYGDLENARLRAQLAEREGQLLRAADAERERQALLDQQDLDFVGDVPRVAARVVSTSPSNYELTVAIDRGRDAGVAEGMPVVTGAGLVGRVVGVSNRRATVLLLTDKKIGRAHV